MTHGEPAAARAPGGPREALLALGLLALALVPHLALARYAFDDAFIHFRVAEQLLRHGQPYFNPGEAVMAASSPAWTVVLALLFAIAPGAIWLVAALNALFTAGGALVWSALARELGGPGVTRTAGWVLALVYVSLVHYAGAGLMETPLALLVLGAGLLQVARGRPAGFAALAAAPFLRLELAVFFPVALAFWIVRRRGPLLPALGAAVLGGLPFAAYQIGFFGTLVPHTALAKSRVYELSRAESLHNLLNFAAPDLPGMTVHGERLAWVLSLLACALVAFVVRERGPSAGARARGVLGLLLLPGAAIAATYVLSAGLVFPWYAPLTSVPLTLGLAILMLQRGRGVVGPAALALLVALPHAAGLAGTLAAAAGDHSGYRYFAANARVRKYLELGARLYREYPEARLLSSEIGGLGYTFRGRLLDGAGLISPAALDWHPLRVPAERSAGFIGAIPAGFVREQRPELIVSLDVFIESFARSDAARDYVLHREPIYVAEDLPAGALPTLWGSRHMNVFVRRDLAPRASGPGDAPE